MDKTKHLTASDLNKALPKATADLYKVVNLSKRTSTCIVHAKHGKVNFGTLTVAQAKELCRMKAPFIEAKKKS